MPTTRTKKGRPKTPAPARRARSARQATVGAGAQSLDPIGPAPARTLRRAPHGTGTTTLGILLSTLVATLLATGVTLLGPFDYHASAVFSIAGSPGDLEALQPYRTELLICAWAALTDTEPDRRLTWNVFAETGATGLRLDLLVRDPQRGEALLRER